MHPIRKRRLILITCMLMTAAVAISLILFALRQNINLFYTPTQLAALSRLPSHEVRLGGLVAKNSVEQLPNELAITFIVTDGLQEYPVVYQGILPNLFREGQGIIVQGQFDQEGVFIAREVLAKHDENYRPPITKVAV